jgi:hypothetical protein
MPQGQAFWTKRSRRGLHARSHHRRAGVPVGRLVAVEPKKPKSRPLGFARGEVWVADDFDAPLPDELLAEFYGGTVPKAIEPPRRKRK